MGKALSVFPPALENANNPRFLPHFPDLIPQRRAAKSQNDHESEQRLHKATRASAKKDGTVWLDKMFADDDWRQIRKLRNPKRTEFCKLWGPDSELVESGKWG